MISETDLCDEINHYNASRLSFDPNPSLMNATSEVDSLMAFVRSVNLLHLVYNMETTRTTI